MFASRCAKITSWKVQYAVHLYSQSLSVRQSWRCRSSVWFLWSGPLAAHCHLYATKFCKIGCVKADELCLTLPIFCKIESSAWSLSTTISCLLVEGFLQHLNTVAPSSQLPRSSVLQLSRSASIILALQALVVCARWEGRWFPSLRSDFLNKKKNLTNSLLPTGPAT